MFFSQGLKLSVHLGERLKSRDILVFSPIFLRFIQVETAFFWRWWNEQDDAMKEQVIKLVNQGRYERLSIQND